MDRAKETPYWRSNVYLPFNRVQFITESEKPDETAFDDCSQNSFSLSCQLNGTEVSNFYNQLVSEPPIFKNQHLNQDVKKNEHLPTDQKVHNAVCKKKPNVPPNNTNIKRLHQFAQDGNMIEILNCIEIGVDLNVKDSYGWTPLMCAVSSGHVGIVKCLLEHGADAHVKTPQGFTASNIAQRQGVCSEIFNLLSNPFHHRIIKEEPIDTSRRKEIRFCDICQKHYEDFTESHERSIAHLFNCKSKTDKTFYHIPEHNKGFQIMLKKGWDGNTGLGPNNEGRKYPIKTILKTDRSCIGRSKNEKQRITHFGPNDTSAVKVHTHRKIVIERERTLKKREQEKLERKMRRKEIAFRREFYSDV